MDRRVALLACAALVCLVAASSGRAQDAKPMPRIYGLNEKSVYQEGCFAPCMCPIMMEAGASGRFRLSSTGDVDSFRTFSIDKVKWSVPQLARQFTGSGSYRFSTGPDPRQQLTLELSENGGAAEKYDSGLVPVETDFPGIAATISIHGIWCYDKVFAVHAEPARANPLVAAQEFDLTWSMVDDPSRYDIAYGTLSVLRDTGGDYTQSTLGCLASRQAPTTLAHSLTPAPGEGLWFLVRAVDSEAWNTYDSNGAAQQAARTDAIDTAPLHCP